MIQLTIAGDPKDCIEVIDHIRHMKNQHIDTIYHQNIPNKRHMSIFVVLDEVGDPRWSIKDLPTIEQFMRAVDRYSWGDVE